MTRQFKVALVVLLLLTGVNAVIITQRLLAPRPVPSERQLAIATKVKNRVARLQAWNKERSTSLLSSTLTSELLQLKEDGLIPELPGAEPVTLASLTEHERLDLAEAITGLLQSYARNSPHALYEYMRSRHLHLSASRRMALTSFLNKHGHAVSALQSMDDEALYAKYWEFLVTHAPQTELLPGASRISVWKWLGHDSQPLIDGNALWKARKCEHVWDGRTVVAANFVAAEPHTLERQATALRALLFADLELVIGHRDSRKAAYLIRYWYNDAHRVWQPVSLVTARPDTEEAFPSVNHVVF